MRWPVRAQVTQRPNGALLIVCRRKVSKIVESPHVPNPACRRMSAAEVFGERVRELRIAQGFSQESFPEAADLHRTYIGSVERGERNVSLNNIVRLARALGVDVAELTGGL